jgi:hypothetical protein
MLKHAMIARGATTTVPNKDKPKRMLVYVPAVQVKVGSKETSAHIGSRVLQVDRNAESKMSINYVVLLTKEDTNKVATLQSDMSKMTGESSDTAGSGTTSTSTGVNFMETLK